MALISRGEFQVEKGFGLPILTTVERTAYTPLQAGYQVYDSNLQVPYYWDGAAWIPSGGADVADLRTLTGTTTGDTDLGIFTGSIITDNTTVKNALQELETATEGKASSTLNSGLIYVGNASNVATGVAMSGEAAIDNAGAVTLDNNSVIGKVLTGFNTGSAAEVTATDSVVAGMGQLQAQIKAIGNAVTLQGTWDASAGTFPGGGTAQNGYSYIVSVAGTVDSVEFNVGDRIVALTDNASTGTYASNWLKLDYTDQVLSVAGKQGAVTLDTDDVTEATNLYFTEARVLSTVLTGLTSATGAITATDSILQAFGKVVGNSSANDAEIASLRTLSGTTTGSNDLGSFTGSIITDNVDVKTALQELESAVGAAAGNTDLGNGTVTATTYEVTSSTGNNVTLAAATTTLAGLMTATDKTNHNALITLSGVAGGSVDLGTFTGTIITDNSTVKDAMQELETAIQGASGYEATFTIGDWVAGSPNTLTIAAGTHGLGAGRKHVTVYDSAGDIVSIEINVNAATGDVVISTAGGTFAGSYFIS